jgi:opacity protein-like surface antigen
MVVPYFGGGIGWYRFTETSPFSDGEFNELSTGYQAIGGLEFRLSRWAAIASEGQYTWVPDGLGLGGVSEVFNERNLGGSQFRIKLLFGR